VGLSPTPAVRVFGIRYPRNSLLPFSRWHRNRGQEFCRGPTFVEAVRFRTWIAVSTFRYSGFVLVSSESSQSASLCTFFAGFLLGQRALGQRLGRVIPACNRRSAGEVLSRYLPAVALARSFRNGHVFSFPVFRKALFQLCVRLSETPLSSHSDG